MANIEGARERSRFAAIFASGTMLSRALGLLRDIVLLAWIPSASMDAFVVAFKLPNMLRDMLGEGAGNAAFIPVISEYQEKKSGTEVRELISALLSAMLLIFSLICVAGLLLIPALPWALDAIRPLTQVAPKDPEQVRTTVRMMQWTFPYLLFIGLAVFTMAPLFTARRYATASWSPALLNISLILTCVSLYSKFPDPAWALITGVWLGGIAQLTVLLFAMRKHCGVWLPNFKLRHPGVAQAFLLLLPVIFGQAAGEVNKLVDTIFAYALETGTVKQLFTANRLVQLPLAVFGVATALAILPDMARAGANHDTPRIRGMLIEGYRRTAFLVLPATVGLVALAAPIVAMLFERSAFTPEDTRRTAAALTLYALGLPAFAAVKIGVQGFFAVQNTRTPVIIASISMLLNILLNILLIGPLGYKGLALSTTLAFTVNGIAIYLLLCRRYGKLWDTPAARALLCMLLASLAMGACAYAAHLLLTGLPLGQGFTAKALPTLTAIAIGAAVYTALCKACRLEELEHALRILRRK